MSEPKIDPEQLAALLDGRLDERQRAEVMARLAESPEAFEAYVDAAAIVGEVERGSAAGAGPGGADVIPLKRPERVGRRWQVARWQWLAAAAVIAGVAVVPLMRRAVGPAVDEMDPGAFVEALSNEDAGLPAGWNGRPWSTTRSASDPLTPEARAVRIGARLVDLELAARAGETAVAAEVAAEVAALLEEIPASGPVAAIYRQITRSQEDSQTLTRLVDRGAEPVARLAGTRRVRLGALLEAARIAAARRDTAFFRARVSLATDTLPGIPNAPGDSARRAIERITSRTPVGSFSDWRMLEQELTNLLRALAT